MLDIHCHFIPGVDDGAKDVATTLNMAKKAKSLGYNAIFATPHYIESSHETQKEDLLNSVEILNNMLKERNINLSIYSGNEIYYSRNVLELLQDEKVCTLANSRYFLMELPFTGKVLGLNELIQNITHVGYIPIIAHPERYDFVNQNYKELYDIIEAGALLQVNLSSILGYYGNKPKATVKKLLKNNMVSIIGTDSHDDKKIYDKFDMAKKKILKLISEDKWEKLTKINPSYIIEDKNIY